MSFNEYKKIHVLFSHENPKSQLSLEIKTNPEDELDIKVKLKFLYEFGLKEFDNNSIMLAFDIDAYSLTKEIKNDFKYVLPNFVNVNEEENISREVQEDDIIASKKNMIISEKIENNEMMLSKKKLIKQDIVKDNEQNLMINSKKYYMFADQVRNKNNIQTPISIDKTNQTDEEFNTIVNNLLLNMNKFKYSIDEYNDKNETKIELDDKPIIEYIKNDENTPLSITTYDDDDKTNEVSDDNKKSGSKSINSNSTDNTKKYKIKVDDNEIDLTSMKNMKQMHIEDKLLQLLDDDLYENKTSLQKKINYKLRLTTAMNNISPTKNIIFIITELMKYIDNFDLSGEDKKTMIISSIKSFLIDEKINEQDINFIVNTVCPELIDILISVDKRDITIKKQISCFLPWCS
jgi:hypothetical protein